MSVTIPTYAISVALMGRERKRAIFERERRAEELGKKIKELGSTFLNRVVRVFFVRSSRILGLCRRSRGLIGIGSGAWLVSRTVGRMWDGLCSA